MEEKEPQLKDGSEWIDHEDCIVGDEQGLKSLIRACETALEKDEYYGNDLGDYVGVKKLETNWFKEPMDSPHTRYANIALGAFLFAVVCLVFVGIGTVFTWIF